MPSLMHPTRYVAFDIETCPLALDDLPEPLRERAARRTAAEAAQKDEPLVEVDRLVRSTDPALLRICCIGVVSTDDPWSVPEVTVFPAHLPGEEAGMLQQFWDAVAAFTNRYGQGHWVSFNGKDFDVPAILMRSAVHGIRPVPCGMLDMYPYGSRPHTDLMHLIGGKKRMRLVELCGALGVPSPKEGHVGGDGVAAALETGGIASVADYCRADVSATMACFARMQAVEQARIATRKR